MNPNRLTADHLFGHHHAEQKHDDCQLCARICCNGNDPACLTHGVAAANERQNQFLKDYGQPGPTRVSDDEKMDRR